MQLLCTGQTPNTTLLRDAFPNAVIADGPDKGMARVRRTLQLAEPVPADELPEQLSQLSISDTTTPELTPSVSPEPESPTSDEEEEEPQPEIEEDPRTRVAAKHIFAVGDAADAFGAVNAGHNAFFQGEVAARNILKMIKASESTDDVVLDKYNPGLPAIKVSLGLVSINLCSCLTRWLTMHAPAEQERVSISGDDRDEGARAGGPGRAPHLAVLWVPGRARRSCAGL